MPWDFRFPLLVTLILCLKSSSALFWAQVCFIPFQKSSLTQSESRLCSLPVQCDADKFMSPGDSPTRDDPHCSPTPCLTRENLTMGADGCLHKFLLAYLKGPVGLPGNVHVSLGSTLLTVCGDSFLHSPLYANFSPCPNSLSKWPCLVLHRKKNHQVAVPQPLFISACSFVLTLVFSLLPVNEVGKEPNSCDRAIPMCGQHLISSPHSRFWTIFSGFFMWAFRYFTILGVSPGISDLM